MEKVVHFDETGGPEKHRVLEQEIASPDAGHVQVEMQAVGLNRRGAHVPRRSIPGSANLCIESWCLWHWDQLVELGPNVGGLSAE